jgi:hypothetical protein
MTPAPGMAQMDQVVSAMAGGIGGQKGSKLLIRHGDRKAG